MSKDLDFYEPDVHQITKTWFLNGYEKITQTICAKTGEFTFVVSRGDLNPERTKFETFLEARDFLLNPQTKSAEGAWISGSHGLCWVPGTLLSVGLEKLRREKLSSVE